MRFWIYSVFLAGWIYMWWWTYVYHIKVCDTDYGSMVDKAAEFVLDAAYPLSFRWSKATPVISRHFEQWRDSIANTLREDQILHITGIAYRDEGPSQTSELGMARARAIDNLFAARVPAEKITLDEITGELTADLRNRDILAYDLRALTRNDNIWEMPGCTLVRLPHDTTTQDVDESIDRYLINLVHRIDTGGTWIKLRTLVNTQSDTEGNNLRWRMDALRERIVVNGIPGDHVLLGGRDEVVPVECIPEEFNGAAEDWIALIFTK